MSISITPSGSGNGTGNVSAAADFFADNCILRADGINKGAQGSGAAIDDIGNLAAMSFTGYTAALGASALTDGALTVYNAGNAFTTTVVPGSPGANNTVTWPAATGTLALTSALSGYLPLAGGTLTGAATATLSALGANTSPVLSLVNSTAAVSGTQQVSPSLVWQANGYGTTLGSSQDVSFMAHVMPAQAGTPTGDFSISSRVNGGSWSGRLQLSTSGTLSVSTISASNTITAGSAQSLGILNRSKISSAADGSLTLTNTAGTDFARLCLGGTTSSFPALARDSTGLSVVAADGSGTAAPFKAGASIFSGPVTLPAYTVATVPSASTFERGQIYVSNESGGATPAFSDGTNWRRYADRAVIS